MKFTLRIDPTLPEEVIAQVHKPSGLTDEIERLVRADAGNDCLTVYDDHHECLLELPFAQIECVSVSNGRTSVFAADQKVYATRLKLYELEEKLPGSFIRINKSALANRSSIARFQATMTGAVNVVFRCGHTDYVSRRCFADIRRRLEDK